MSNTLLILIILAIYAVWAVAFFVWFRCRDISPRVHRRKRSKVEHFDDDIWRNIYFGGF